MSFLANFATFLDGFSNFKNYFRVFDEKNLFSANVVVFYRKIISKFGKNLIFYMIYFNVYNSCYTMNNNFL